MNTTPRVVTRGIATDIRTSCVQGTSSPTASPQNAPAPAGRAADIVPHGPPGRPTWPPAGLSARFCQHGPVLIHPWDQPVSDQEWRGGGARLRLRPPPPPPAPPRGGGAGGPPPPPSRPAAP